MATLSDDEFQKEMAQLLAGKPNDLIKIETPPAPAAAATPVVETPPAPVVVDTPAPAAPVETPVETPPETKQPTAAEMDAAAKAAREPAKVEAPPANGADPAAPKPGDAPAKTAEQVLAEQTAANAPAVIDYEGIYKRIFGTPIKAAGKEITVLNADEAISLIQKGVGFHSKLNKLQPDLKFVEMLRNNGLLDEAKLSLLIDAQAGKPGAIKKLLDSAKLDPLTLDSAEASTYAPSDHRVSDNQVQFQSVVNDLRDSTSGAQLLIDAQGWDQNSKAEIYKTPDVLTMLAHQKESGRYDKIKAQVDREKLLGNIPPTEGFLVSYARVGQQMMQAGAFGEVKTPTPTPTPTPVVQKVITPPAPPNAVAAAAAAPTRKTTPAPKPAVASTKGMSDEDFMKVFKTTIKI